MNTNIEFNLAQQHWSGIGISSYFDNSNGYLDGDVEEG